MFILNRIKSIIHNDNFKEKKIRFFYYYNINGECFREQPGRKVLKIIEIKRNYFLKVHLGVGWKEIFKNIFYGRLPIISAYNEVESIYRLQKFKFVPSLISYDYLGANPSKRRSFVITKEISNSINLEDLCLHWPKGSFDYKLKINIIKKIAETARIIHNEGINHRDLYLCHFLLDTNYIYNKNYKTIKKLYVIDWHRAQIRKKIPMRWRVKDIASLYFSAMDIGLTNRDLLIFKKTYGYNSELFWKKVEKRAIKTYKKICRKLSHNRELPFYLYLKDGSLIEIFKIIDYKSKKYLIASGLWCGKPVLIRLINSYFKAFFYKKICHDYKELKIIKKSWSKHRAIYIQIYNETPMGR